jgi:hypothetical protein
VHNNSLQQDRRSGELRAGQAPGKCWRKEIRRAGLLALNDVNRHGLHSSMATRRADSIAPDSQMETWIMAHNKELVDAWGAGAALCPSMQKQGQSRVENSSTRPHSANFEPGWGAMSFRDHLRASTVRRCADIE